MKRKAPDVPSHLSAQIIAAAARMEQGVKSEVKSEGSYLAVLLSDIRAMLVVPRPAYAMAFVLVIGLSLGAMGSVESIAPGGATGELSSFMLIEDRFVASEFTGGEWG